MTYPGDGLTVAVTDTDGETVCEAVTVPDTVAEAEPVELVEADLD